MSVHVVPAPGELAKGGWLDTNVFTDIAFETGCGLLQLEERHVYVTSISGAVYQVSCLQNVHSHTIQATLHVGCQMPNASTCLLWPAFTSGMSSS